MTQEEKQKRNISIHSLRVEGDSTGNHDELTAARFQSTPSVWRETLLIRAKYGSAKA